MKKLFIATIIALVSFAGFSQGRLLTKEIQLALDRLEQPAFAALAFADSTKTQSLTVDTWSVISEFIAIASNDVTTSDDTITIQKAGGYAVDASLSFYATASDTIVLQLFKNTTAFGPKYYSTAGAILSDLSFSTYVSCSQGDIITMKIQNAASSDDAVLKSGSLFIRRIYQNK